VATRRRVVSLLGVKMSREKVERERTAYTAENSRHQILNQFDRMTHQAGRSAREEKAEMERLNRKRL